MLNSVERLFDKAEETHLATEGGWAHRWRMLKLRLSEILSKQVHVICCNDSVEAVVIGSKARANRKCAQMKAAHIKKHYYYMKGKELEDKERVLYYHLHTVDVFFIN